MLKTKEQGSLEFRKDMMRTSSLYPVIMTIITWRPPNLSLPLVSPEYQVGISKCSKVSKCTPESIIPDFSYWHHHLSSNSSQNLEATLTSSCRLTHLHLIDVTLSKYVLYIDPLSLNFHFQYLGWCQCYLCSGFYNNLLTMLLTLPSHCYPIHVTHSSNLAKFQIIYITHYCPQNKMLCITPMALLLHIFSRYSGCSQVW